MGLFASMFPGITGFNPAFEKPMMQMFGGAPPKMRSALMQQFSGLRGAKGPFESVMHDAFAGASPDVQNWARGYASQHKLPWLSGILGAAPTVPAGAAPATRSMAPARAAAAPTGGGRFNLYGISNHGRASVDGLQGPYRQALGQMMDAAPPNIQRELRMMSGYRSPEHQADLYAAAVRKYGPDRARHWVAPPGNSQHNKGGAIDWEFGSPAAREWVHANAARFGFGFPMGHEPWHMELTTARGGHGAPVLPHTSNPDAALSSAAGMSNAPPGVGAGLSSPMVPAALGGPMASIAGGAGGFGGFGGGGGVATGINMTAADLEAPTGPMEAALAAGQANQAARAAAEGFAPVFEQVSTSGKPMQEAFGAPGFDDQGRVGPFTQLTRRPGLADLTGGVKYRA